MEKRCAICGGFLGHKELTFEGYDICSCDNCTHRQLFPIPSDDIIDAYYAQENDTIGNANAFRNIHDYLGNKEIFHKFNLLRLKQLFRYGLLNDNSIKFLEVGCGPGFFLALLRDFYGFNHLTGIDISKPIVDEGRKRLDVDLICGDVGKMGNFPKGHFDFIYCYHALEHSKNPLEIVSKIKKNL